MNTNKDTDTTVQSEQSHIPVLEKENKGSFSEIVGITELEDSLFKLVETDAEGEKRYFLGIKDARVTELNTRDELVFLVNNRDWGLITSMCCFIADNINEILRKG